jgi:transcriptional regulator with XRE-family HTH domain
MLEHDARASQSVAASTRRTQLPAMPTAEQIRAARALLRWSAARLARAAGVAPSTVARCEAGSGIPPVGVPTLQKIQRALEDAGVEFTRENAGGGPGVRQRRQ